MRTASSYAALIDRFNPLWAPRPRLERITEVLRLAKDLPIPELHDADSVGRLASITDDIFGNPKIAVAKHAPNGEALLGSNPRVVRMASRPRMRSPDWGILQHGVFVIDLILSFVVTGLGRPVAVAETRVVGSTLSPHLGPALHFTHPSSMRTRAADCILG
jgi:hypothetical protein